MVIFVISWFLTGALGAGLLYALDVIEDYCPEGGLSRRGNAIMFTFLGPLSLLIGLVCLVGGALIVAVMAVIRCWRQAPCRH